MSLEHSVSLHSLIRALDVLMCEHIVASWIPDALSLLEESRLDIAAQLKSFGDELRTGTDPSQQDALLDLDNFVLQKCRKDLDAEVEAIHGSASTEVHVRNAANWQELQDREAQDREYLENPTDSLALDDTRDCLIRIVLMHLGAAFETVEPATCMDRIKALGAGWAAWLRGETAYVDDRDVNELQHHMQAFNWGRFPALLAALKADIRSHFSERWESHALPAIKEYLQLELGRSPATVISQDVLPGNCTAIGIRKMLADVREGFITRRVQHLLEQDGTLLQEQSTYAEERSRLQALLHNTDHSIRLLKEVEARMAAHAGSLQQQPTPEPGSTGADNTETSGHSENTNMGSAP